jgi:hypothetical protein
LHLSAVAQAGVNWLEKFTVNMRSTRRPTVNYEPDNLSSYKQSIYIYFQNSWLKCLLLPFSAFMLIINSFIIKLQWKQIKWRAEKYRIRQVTNREL